MKTMAAVGVVLFAYLALAAAQDAPLQVSLLALAPFALIAIALVLHITDFSKSN